MRKYVEKLVNATNDKVVGNHSVYFHNHLHVCYREDKKKVYYITRQYMVKGGN